MFGRLGQRLLQVDFVVVGGAAVGFGGIEPPELAVGDDGPVRAPVPGAIQQGDDGRAGVFLGRLGVALLVLAVQAAPPGVGQAERQGGLPAVTLRGSQDIVRLNRGAFVRRGKMRREAQDSEGRLQ